MLTSSVYLSLEEKLDILMELLFENDEIKQIYYDRYSATLRKIRETGTNNYSNLYGHYEPDFDEVEFIEHYEEEDYELTFGKNFVYFSNFI